MGRIRRDPSHERCLNMWVVHGDNLRSAATNAVQVAELLHERGQVRAAQAVPGRLANPDGHRPGRALLIVGGLLAVARLSGVTRPPVLSISVLAVTAGIELAAADVVSVNARDAGLLEIVELALILTLFSDGMFVERGSSAVAGPARPRARDRDADHDGAARARRVSRVPRAELGRGLPARRDPFADRSRCHIHRGHGAARADGGPPRSTSSRASTTDSPLPFVLFFLILATAGGAPGGRRAARWPSALPWGSCWA